jgi:hypothetical protein
VPWSRNHHSSTDANQATKEKRARHLLAAQLQVYETDTFTEMLDSEAVEGDPHSVAYNHPAEKPADLGCDGSAPASGGGSSRGLQVK